MKYSTLKTFDIQNFVKRKSERDKFMKKIFQRIKIKCMALMRIL